MTVSYLLGAIVGTLLVGSGIAKLAARERFRTALEETYGFGHALARTSAWLLPVTEVVVGSFLLLPPSSAVAMLAAVAVLSGITVVVISAWARGASGECGCLGALSQSQLSGVTVLRAGALWTVTLAAWLLSLELGTFSAARGLPDAIVLALIVLGIAVAGTVLTVAGRMWLRWHRGNWEANG